MVSPVEIKDFNQASTVPFSSNSLASKVLMRWHIHTEVFGMCPFQKKMLLVA